MDKKMLHFKLCLILWTSVAAAAAAAAQQWAGGGAPRPGEGVRRAEADGENTESAAEQQDGGGEAWILEQSG